MAPKPTGTFPQGELAMQQAITLTVNGAERTVTTDPDRPLLDVLREDLLLTGAKYGCGERQCGACTVLINGRPAFSCATRVATANGREITTIEGIGSPEQLHPVQQAMLESGALQCGFCTCGIVMAAVALLRETPRPTEEQIRDGMQNNVCRCGTYVRIIEAVKKAATAGA
jgi:aerobic-type carbon monoxide dehydrogenase small subunit (CoxS/CutS family)